MERGELRSVLAHLLALHLATASAVRGEQEHEPGDRDILVSYEAVRENLASGTDTYNTVTYGDLTVGGGLPFAGGVDSARAQHGRFRCGGRRVFGGRVRCGARGHCAHV